MAQEIERKFLVAGDFKPFAKKATRITQGYLSSVPERTVRVRVKGEKGFITIKGIGSASGASRFEWEKEIPVAEVQDLLQISIEIVDGNRTPVRGLQGCFKAFSFLLAADSQAVCTQCVIVCCDISVRGKTDMMCPVCPGLVRA